MRKKSFIKKSGQALIELAVLGALIITAFSYLIYYSEKLNREQSYLMQTFRRSLAAAHSVGGTATANTVAYRRMPNITNPYHPGQQAGFGHGSVVLWGTQGGETTSDREIGSSDETTDVTVTFTRREAPGSLPVTQHTVTGSLGTRSGP